jgi:hypothetical protein
MNCLPVERARRGAADTTYRKERRGTENARAGTEKSAPAWRLRDTRHVDSGGKIHVAVAENRASCVTTDSRCVMARRISIEID